MVLSFNIKSSAKIEKLKWREGKWPGYLGIKFNGYKNQAKKISSALLLPFIVLMKVCYQQIFLMKMLIFLLEMLGLNMKIQIKADFP